MEKRTQANRSLPATSDMRDSVDGASDDVDDSSSSDASQQVLPDAEQVAQILGALTQLAVITHARRKRFLGLIDRLVVRRRIGGMVRFACVECGKTAKMRQHLRYRGEKPIFKKILISRNMKIFNLRKLSLVTSVTFSAVFFR
jgi:hypothetical protein